MMEKTKRRPETFLPLTPAVFHILLSLADRDRHGYGIMQEVRARTQDRVHLRPGTLYGAIKRLLEDGLIEEADERADPGLNDERRRYYHLTNFGRRVAQAESERLARLVHQAQVKRILNLESAMHLGGALHFPNCVEALEG
jgi:DNA-binding PadR family transcriptional regulator